MGLDMYVYAVEDVEDTLRDTLNHWVSGEEIFYWRKHPDLHGWFKDIFYRKGGHRDSEFNGESVRITLEDLNTLESELVNNTLPTTRGFFFGESYHDQGTLDTDLEFIKKAKDALAENKILYYTSSW